MLSPAAQEMLNFILILSSLQFVLPEDKIMKQPQQMPRSQQPLIKLLQQARANLPSNLSDYYPFNVTISHLSPRSIEISWSCKDNTLNDRYEVTIKPVLASYKVVETVPNNMCYLLMDKLEPDTTYQVAVTSIAGRNRRRSGYVIFRTFLEDDYTEFTEDDGGDQLYEGGYTDPASSSPTEKDRIRLPRVRLVEISLVGMALVLWAGAIVLFFHRWGKIRMLLPYQPDYKAMQNSNASCTTCSLTPHHQCQKIHHLQNPGTTPAECYQAQGLTTTYHHPYPHHTPHHHLPHQPMSEPGPSCSSFGGGHNNINVVTVTESGCSPIRYKMPVFNDDGDISIEMALERHHLNTIQRKSRSAEQLKQYVYPWEEPSDLECTEF